MLNQQDRSSRVKQPPRNRRTTHRTRPTPRRDPPLKRKAKARPVPKQRTLLRRRGRKQVQPKENMQARILRTLTQPRDRRTGRATKLAGTKTPPRRTMDRTMPEQSIARRRPDRAKDHPQRELAARARRLRSRRANANLSSRRKDRTASVEGNDFGASRDQSAKSRGSRERPRWRER